MLMKRKKFVGVVLSVIVTASMLLTSCDAMGDNAKQEIEKVVDDYMSEIEDGSFAENDFESDYATDTPFEEIEFADDLAKDAMLIGMEKFSYEIGEIVGSTSKAEGSCDVTITSLDIEKITKDLEEDGLTYEAFEEAIKAKKAPTDETTITLDLEYDASSKKWEISDSESIVKVFADPYQELSFRPKAGDPVPVVESFFAALSAADETSLADSSSFYAVSDFIYGDEIEIEIYKAFYKTLTFETLEDPQYPEDGTAVLDISLQYVDIDQVTGTIIEDETVITQMWKYLILGQVNGTDGETEAYTYLAQVYSDAVLDSGADKLSEDITVTMELNEAEDGWLVLDMPIDAITAFDFDTEPSDELFYSCSLLALDELLQDGEIDEATYNSLYAEITGDPVDDPTEAPITIGDSEVAQDLVFASWYDYAIADYCTSYDSAQTTTLEMEIEFANIWDGLVIYYDYYNVNGTVLMASSTVTMGPEDYTALMQMSMSDGTNIPADTYLFVAYLEDGSVLLESTIMVF